MNNEHIDDPCNISSGMFGIRYSYSDNYYATHGEDRGCSSTDGTLAFNASQGGRFILLDGQYFRNKRSSSCDQRSEGL